MTAMFRSRDWNASNQPAQVLIDLPYFVRRGSRDRRRDRFHRRVCAPRSRALCRAVQALPRLCRKIETKVDDGHAAMKFWDASAVIPLLANEPARERLLALLERDPQVLIWWGTTVEIASALARRERESLLSADEVASALVVAHELADSWHEIVPSDAVRRTAERLLRVHPLRAADSLQLAAALIAADHDPSTLEMVCLDARLTSAARREGFTVLEN
jgi:hypothetical protein